MGDKTLDGIKLDSVSTNTHYTSTGAYLDLHYRISIGEPFDIARADADFMEITITNMLSDFVIDYAADGQEVD